MLGETWALGALAKRRKGLFYDKERHCRRRNWLDTMLCIGKQKLTPADRVLVRAHLELSVPGLGPGPGQDDIVNPGSGGRYGAIAPTPAIWCFAQDRNKRGAEGERMDKASFEVIDECYDGGEKHLVS